MDGWSRQAAGRVPPSDYGENRARRPGAGALTVRRRTGAVRNRTALTLAASGQLRAASCLYHHKMGEPKSAYELAMEKLKKKDADAGIEEQVLTDAQRSEIAEARSVYDSRVAERRIMHQSAIAGVFEPAEREQRDSEFRRDLERFATDRDAKIKKIRGG